MSTEREWDTHAPNVEPRNCRYCGESFYPEKTTFRYCPEHRSQKYIYLVHRDKQKDLGLPVQKKKVNQKPKDVGYSAIRFTKGESRGPISPSRKMAELPNSFDDAFALLEEEFLLEQRDVLSYLETNEIVYGRSVTEHHQRPLVEARLEMAIERINPKKVEGMRRWAREQLWHPNRNSVEATWSTPALNEKEQQVINLLKKRN